MKNDTAGPDMTSTEPIANTDRSERVEALAQAMHEHLQEIAETGHNAIAREKIAVGALQRIAQGVGNPQGAARLTLVRLHGDG